MVGCLLIGLSAVHQLNSLHLTGITTSLIVSVLIVELYGGSSSHVSFFEVKNPKVNEMNYLATEQVYGEIAKGYAPKTDDILKLVKTRTRGEPPANTEVLHQGWLVDEPETQEKTSADPDFILDRDSMLKAMYGID